MSGSLGKNLCFISFYDAGFYTGRQGFFTTGIVSNIVMYDGIARTPLSDEYNAEVLRWYDHWLKGIDTGIMDEPPIRFWVNGRAEWRTEREWPLARTRWTKLYLHRWQGLSFEPEETPGKPDAFVQQPPDETDELESVMYVSERLEHDTEVTGPVACVLYAAIDQDDTNWFVSIRDVAPGGKEVELTKGFITASHRALDETRSTPYEPYHPHTEARPVAAGEVTEYAIALAPMSNVFKAGHRIKLVISSMDHARARNYELAPESLGRTHAPWHLCSSMTTLHKIHHDAAQDPPRRGPSLAPGAADHPGVGVRAARIRRANTWCRGRWLGGAPRFSCHPGPPLDLIRGAGIHCGYTETATSANGSRRGGRDDNVTFWPVEAWLANPPDQTGQQWLKSGVTIMARRDGRGVAEEARQIKPDSSGARPE